MILCIWKCEWLLAERATRDIVGLSLRARNAIGSSFLAREGFRQQELGSFWHRSVPDPSEVNAYPELLYRGARVYPEAWHRESSVPLLRCLMMSWDVKPELLFGYKPTNSQEVVRLIVADGWEWSPPDGARKYISVDDLEKIEGPVPAGAF